jgi:hypothetical protein
MPADLREDRAHPDDGAARAAFDAARGETRVLGPGSGGVHARGGDIGLLSALGPAVSPLLEALGDRIGLAVDLGLAWDLGSADALTDLEAAIAEGHLRLLLLALPMPHDEATTALWREASPALRALEGRVPMVAVATGPFAEYLENRGIATLPSRAGLAHVARLPQPRTGTSKIAVISPLAPTSSWLGGALAAAGLSLAEPAAETLAQLESELPRHARLGGHVQIPTPTARHLEVARTALASDPGVALVWTATEGDPQLGVDALAATLRAHAALSEGPSPLPSPAGDEAGSALLYARRLMRRDVIERSEALAILGAFTRLEVAPSIAVANLAMATHAAARLGFPVLLGPGATAPIADASALTTAWEALLADLSAASSDVDPWGSRHIIPVRGETRSVRVTLTPLPVLEVSGANLRVALPLRDRELDRLGPLGPLARALEAVADLPEVRSLSALATVDGTVLDAAITLARAERPTD